MEFGPEIRDGLDQLFRWRRDVRHFQSKPIPPGLIDDLLAQADTAPSVGLSQPWRWVRVFDPDRRSQVAENFQTANAEALAACADDRQKIYAKLKLSGLEQAPEHLAVFCDDATKRREEATKRRRDAKKRRSDEETRRSDEATKRREEATKR